MDVHDPFRSKSSEIQLKKSNWIWIIPNPIPGLGVEQVEYLGKKGSAVGV
jgi:hypothetical protein